MTIRESIANMMPGDPPMAVSYKHVVDYVRILAKINGQNIRQEKQPGGEYLIWCIGEYGKSTLVWLRKNRARRKYINKWRKNNPRIVKYRIYVRKLILAGTLVKQPCEVCGNVMTDGHHDDYAKPEKVRWLCRKHHRQWHQQYTPKNKKYLFTYT
jgi:hypothetical protein